MINSPGNFHAIETVNHSNRIANKEDSNNHQVWSSSIDDLCSKWDSMTIENCWRNSTDIQCHDYIINRKVSNDLQQNISIEFHDLKLWFDNNYSFRLIVHFLFIFSMVHNQTHNQLDNENSIHSLDLFYISQWLFAKEFFGNFCNVRLIFHKFKNKVVLL